MGGGDKAFVGLVEMGGREGGRERSERPVNRNRSISAAECNVKGFFVCLEGLSNYLKGFFDEFSFVFADCYFHFLEVEPGVSIGFC